jgi:hypothetical protein
MRRASSVLSMSCAVALMFACGAATPAVAATPAALHAYAQAEKETTTTKVTRWTKARYEAAKRRWAQNRQKFSECTGKLSEMQKGKRISVHDRGHFMQDCMAQKP